MKNFKEFYRKHKLTGVYPIIQVCEVETKEIGAKKMVFMALERNEDFHEKITIIASNDEGQSGYIRDCHIIKSQANTNTGDK